MTLLAKYIMKETMNIGARFFKL